MILLGSAVSAVSPFFLAMGHTYTTAIGFVVSLSLGEAIWSPRLFEYTVMVAEQGREGTYMALASAPTFMATLVSGAMSGWLLETFCPAKGPRLVVKQLASKDEALLLRRNPFLAVNPRLHAGDGV